MLFLYLPKKDQAAKRLERAIKVIFPAENTEIHDNVESFSKRLREPFGLPKIAILLVSERKDLSDMLSIRDLLTGLRIILILPDADNETIAKAHALRPRCLTYSNGDFIEVVAVLTKMIGGFSPRDGSQRRQSESTM